MIVYFQATLDYNDGHSFSNDFILWFDVIVVYFQTTFDYDDDHCLFLNNFILWYDVMTFYFQMISYCDGCFVFQTTSYSFDPM